MLIDRWLPAAASRLSTRGKPWGSWRRPRRTQEATAVKPSTSPAAQRKTSSWTYWVGEGCGNPQKVQRNNCVQTHRRTGLDTYITTWMETPFPNIINHTLVSDSRESETFKWNKMHTESQVKHTELWLLNTWQPYQRLHSWDRENWTVCLIKHGGFSSESSLGLGFSFSGTLAVRSETLFVTCHLQSLWLVVLFVHQNSDRINPIKSAHDNTYHII